MTSKTLMAAALLALGAAGPAFADAIPYPTIGTINTATYDFNATADGDLVVYFYGQSAGDTEFIGARINGVDVTSTLSNHDPAQGTSFDFGPVSAGDSLVFYIQDGSTRYYSDASLNTDGIQHAYSTSFSGLAGFIPAGTYVSFEDQKGGGDRDYNDTAFVFTNVSTTPAVPEPGNLALLLAGLGLTGFLARRRRG